MTVEAANASWLTLVASSAVVSALVNVGWNVCSKLLDRKREDEKDRKRVGHVYLDIALQLESFAKRSDAYLYDISNALWHRAAHHDEFYIKKLKSVSLSFEPEPNWTELPIPFVARLKALPGQSASTERWIRDQWDTWADIEDVYHLEEQCVAYYGIKVLDVADDIRREINAGIGDSGTLREHFTSEIETRRKRFAEDRTAITLIPELEAMFKSEYPETSKSSMAADEDVM
ncbi:hypothetical protein [Cupriavidus pauculus]|uniref:Uncharacterized protein n=1 Tax=Cupriavidus pauculus TaxID=82633 RepID=A0A2N5C3M6_9BURK|nr:hypothetical protein [Cupriavidus pauculus]PLP96822.1 hypothetical protein CYJ10_29970 [Cupriavidus pauculus]